MSGVESAVKKFFMASVTALMDRAASEAKTVEEGATYEEATMACVVTDKVLQFLGRVIA